MVEQIEGPAFSFEHLVAVIGQTHAELAAQASRAVNISITMRNWLIGFHIAVYEQQGTDRARYGDKLIERLSERLNQGCQPLRSKGVATLPPVLSDLPPNSGHTVSRIGEDTATS